MNPQQYFIYNHSDERKEANQQWIETVTDISLRTESIKAKIIDLIPDLNQIIETDNNFKNRQAT